MRVCVRSIAHILDCEVFAQNPCELRCEIDKQQIDFEGNDDGPQKHITELNLKKKKYFERAKNESRNMKEKNRNNNNNTNNNNDTNGRTDDDDKRSGATKRSFTSDQSSLTYYKRKTKRKSFFQS